MSDSYAYGALPGMGTLRETDEKIIWWGREVHNLYVSNLKLDDEAIDAGNSPTSSLRAGLLLGRHTSSDNLYAWDPDAIDGREELAGVLLRDLSMLDADGVAEEKYGHVLLAGSLKASELLVEGTALASSTDEYLARRQMFGRFLMDDDQPMKPAWLGVPFSNKTIADAGTTVLTAADCGKRIIFSSASAVQGTLPTIENGLVYEFLRTANEEMAIVSAEGDNMIVGNDVSADSVTFTTAGEQIGAIVRVEGILVGGTLKWLVTTPVVPFGTGSFLTLAIAT